MKQNYVCVLTLHITMQLLTLSTTMFHHCFRTFGRFGTLTFVKLGVLLLGHVVTWPFFGIGPFIPHPPSSLNFFVFLHSFKNCLYEIRTLFSSYIEEKVEKIKSKYFHKRFTVKTMKVKNPLHNIIMTNFVMGNDYINI